MVSISGSKKLKRQMAPTFWGITRKEKRFVVTVKPGPHSKNYSIPNAVFLRDTLWRQAHLQRRDDFFTDGVLKLENIRHVAIVTLGPDVAAICAID